MHQPQPHQPSNADFSAWGFDGATAQLGMQLGSSAVAAGQDYVSRNFGTYIPSGHIKHQFNVSNSYVIKKLRLLLFPWLHKTYFRRPRAQGEWLPPREDINSPDLYIPGESSFGVAMVWVVILGESASRALMVLFFDFGFVKLGCYLLSIPASTPVSDLLAYGGYKFVNVIFSMTAAFLGLKGPLWTLIFLYAFSSYGFFLLRSLRAVILPDSANVPATQGTGVVTQAQRRRRIIFLLAVAVLQIVYMGWLVRV
ncbi:hypothetical protein CPB84DRAFT_1781305 [Gymnopilus junonius]|uniref:Protein YIF1 n=1 Tax=Gymnopilus junonius TaxID=109634 RepID=A0A9P5TLG4_GYMJU|nr:hypothetical protein CPB84DRAFT_1781305 [Gymnopilus junonius]